MPLTYEQLLKFDLLDLAENQLMGRDAAELGQFFRLWNEIDTVDKFMTDMPAQPGTTDKIVRDEMVSGIGATLAIEGIDVSEEEIEESFRKAALNERLARKDQASENSRKVYRFINELVDDQGAGLVYTVPMVKQIHKYFTDGMNYVSNVPGQYRDFPVTFGTPRKSSLCRNEMEVEAAVAGLVDWLNKPGAGLLTSSPIARAIMAHYYVGEIHPFGDGNGRTARALEALVLLVNGVNAYCFWSLANFWSLHRDAYLVHLDNVRQTLSAVDYVLWGMQGFLDKLKTIKARVLTKVRQLMLIDHVRFLLQDKRNQEIKVNHRILEIMRILVKRGRMDYNRFRDLPEVAGLQAKVKSSSRYRDWETMERGELVLFTREGKKKYIEPNFSLLDKVRY